jgi:hypothetical protein
MRLLFVGGNVDNSELDFDLALPQNYPSDTGSGQPRYRLYEVGHREGEPVYAVYAAPQLAADAVEEVIAERDYPRRFGADSRERPSA